jgi:acyl-CoA reductase-like NAD-dependent aldehyde dehydrogenase
MAQLDVIAAYDQSLLAQLETIDIAEANARLARAHGVYDDRSRWLPAEERIAILERLAQLITEQRQFLALQAAREGGKPLTDSLVELDRARSGVLAAKEAVPRLVGREIPMNLNAASRGRIAYTYREPRGVVLAVSAFNHPVNLLIHQAVTAFAAGCPVLLKPSHKTPLSAISLVKLMHEAGVPENYVQLLLCDNETTERLAADPRVAFLNFIGSSKVGFMLRSKLSSGAACVLEHGGVAPVIVDETADVDDALPLLTKASFYHAGQVCVSIQRIFAHESIALGLAERLAQAAKKLQVGDPTLMETEVGPLIRPDEVIRVRTWVNEAVERDARALVGAECLGPTTYAPTVLMNPPDDARVSTTEIFGPVVSVYSYTDIDDAIRRANLPNMYFQAALFTNRLDRALDVSRRLHGTAVMVNDHTAFRVDWMPFGGHRESGAGMGGIENAMHDATLERMVVFRQK